MLYNSLKDGIYIIHENEEWIPPFKDAFERAGVPFDEILLTEGSISLDSPPPHGVFWSRLSASSHTRSHAMSKEYGRAILGWLEHYGRRVVNGLSVLEFEISKINQYLMLKKYGFVTPKTVAVFGRFDLIPNARTLTPPFISKHNQGGKGLGVRRFDSHEEFADYVNGSEFEEPIDGITLLQEYVLTKEFFITRCEFIGSRFFYAVRVDTSAGSFELCPADSCNVQDRLPGIAGAACEVPKPAIAGAACEVGPGASKFTLREDITESDPLIVRLQRFLIEQNIQVAGVEFMETADGRKVVYDINTNTNYNSAVENALRSQGKKGAADRVVEYLHSELRAQQDK